MKFRPLEKIDALPEVQRQQLADWLGSDLTLDKVIELLQTEFGVEIPRTTLHRFRKRVSLTDYLDASPESARARAELINSAASGRPNFSQATLDLLEKHAFELAHTPWESEAMDALKNLFTLINGHKNTATRERLAAVQERKATLREKELELKQSVHTRNPDLNPDRSPEVPAQSDHLGYFAANLDERATKQFNLPPLPKKTEPAPSTSVALVTSDPPQSGEPASSQVTANAATNLVPLPGPSSSALEPPPSNLDSDSSRQSAPTCPPSASLEPSSEPSAVQNSSVSITENSCPAFIVSHAIKRWRSFMPRAKDAPEPDNSWKDECPCGKLLPCADHGDLWMSLRYYRPQTIGYREIVEEAGLPYYIPTAAELGCSEETLKKAIDPFTNNPRLKDAVNPYVDPFQGKFPGWASSQTRPHEF